MLLLVLKWLILITFPIFLVSYFLLKRAYRYWDNKGIPYIKPHVLFGNIKELMLLKETEVFLVEKVYNQLKESKYAGMYYFWRPALVINDIELAKKVLVSDFKVFKNHPDMSDMSGTDIVLKSLFLMKDDIWKERRADFAPLFSSKALKGFFPGLLGCCLESIKLLEDKPDGVEIELEMVCQRMAINAVTSVFFGIKTDILENANSNFLSQSKHIGNPSPITVLKRLLYMFFPNVYKGLKLQTFPACVWDYFSKFVAELVSEVERNGGSEGNLLDLLIKMKNDTVKDGKTAMTLDEIVGHICSFYVAGSDTTSIGMTFCLYNLSLNKEVQDKLRTEVDRAWEECGGQLTYETLQTLTYMDLVMIESLRMYPPLGVLKRESSCPYDIGDGTIIEPGTLIIVPVQSLHYDPRYFPDPNEFKPERFEDEPPPFIHMPFGKGPRMCNGMQFAELEIKIILFYLIRHYHLEPSPKTSRPMEFDPKTVAITCRPKNGAWAKLRRRNHI